MYTDLGWWSNVTSFSCGDTISTITITATNATSFCSATLKFMTLIIIESNQFTVPSGKGGKYFVSSDYIV